MSTQSIIEKVKKLRALATSSNVNEAASAAAAAERLIQEHALHEAQLCEDEEDEIPIDPEEPIDTFGSKTPSWRSSLLAGLAKQYRCACWLTRGRNNGKRETYFRAVGRPSDLDVFRYQAAFFTSEILRLTEREGKGQGRTWRNSFAHGAVSAVLEAMRTANQEARSTATGAALVRVDVAAAKALALRDTIVPSLRKGSASRYSLDGSAYAQGRRAGAGINQRSQIGAGGMRLLGSG